jgi:hypothetical protein
MNVQHALSGRYSNTCTGQAVNPSHGRANSTKSLAASERAVRPLAASARSQRFGTGSGHYAEPALGIEDEVCLSAHSLLREAKKPMPSRAKASLGQVTACSERMQALRRSAEPNARGSAVPAALPNPSIERDVQRLSPLAAPHVKR